MLNKHIQCSVYLIVLLFFFVVVGRMADEPVTQVIDKEDALNSFSDVNFIFLCSFLFIGVENHINRSAENTFIVIKSFKVL